MKRINYPRAAGVLAVLALAIPASATAEPGVYTVDAKLDTGSVTFLNDATGAGLLPQTQYVVSNNGYSVGFAETNGVTGSGVLNYKVLPSAYRAPATAEEKRTYPAAQTDVQAHATCSGVAALTSGANILAWQTGNDPSYNYIPWQKASAGLGDDPGKWIPVVKTATGVDLSTVSNFTTACTDLGGAYHAADTASAIASSLIANAVTPLQKQIDTLTKAKTTAEKASATDKAARKLAEEGYQALFARPLIVTLAAKRFAPSAGVALVTGSVTDPVVVTIEVTKKQKRALGLPSREIVAVNDEIGDQGAVLITLKPDKATLKALAKRKRPIPVTVHAVSGGLQDSIKATLKP
jgi:hypothetical protein